MNTQENTSYNPITEGVIWKQLLLFFFPILIGSLFQQLYNTADTVIVSRFVGKAALAGIGGNGSVLTNVIIGFFTGLSSGACVTLSQYYGAKDGKNLHKSLHTAYAFSIVASIILSVVGYVMTPWMMTAMKTPADAYGPAVTYLRIYFLGLLATLIYNMGSAVMRSLGDSKRPLYYLIICCVLNIALDLFFILVLDMGVAGAAIATVLSQIVSAVLVTRALMHHYPGLKLNLREIGFDFPILKKQIKIGIPAAIQSCIYSISNVIAQTAINGLGTDTAAAWGATWKLDAAFWTTNMAFGIAMATFAGQNFGAGKYKRVTRSVRVCMLMAVSICGMIQLALLVFSRPLFGIFTSDANVIEIGVYLFWYLIPFYTLAVVGDVLSSTLRGLGDVLVPTVIALGGIGFVRLPWIMILDPIYHHIDVVLSSYIVSWSAVLVLMIPYYFVRVRKILR